MTNLLNTMSNGQLVFFIEDNADSLSADMRAMAEFAEELLMSREERENAMIS